MSRNRRAYSNAPLPGKPYPFLRKDNARRRAEALEFVNIPQGLTIKQDGLVLLTVG